MVTTPQEAAAEVAERAGTMASMMHQRVVGVIENMSYLPCPHCAPGAPARGVRLRRRRPGRRDAVAAGSATTCRCSAEIPLDIALREGGDAGTPIVESDPTAPAAPSCCGRSPSTLSGRGRGLAGMQLGLTPAGRL